MRVDQKYMVSLEWWRFSQKWLNDNWAKSVEVKLNIETNIDQAKYI